MSLDLSKPWRSYHVVSCDFETTGPNPDTCEPVEVACVRFDGNGSILSRFTSLLRPDHPIPEDATRVHGITNEMVQDAPTLVGVMHELAEVAEGAVPLAYNRGYDRKVMHRYLSGEGVTVFDPEQPWLCAFAMAWSADRWEPGAGRHKLTACCERRGIRVVGAHRAEADAIACGMLFFSLMTGAKAETTMAQVLDRVNEREAERELEHAKWVKKCRAEDRVIWRQYAAAALSGVFSRDSTVELQSDNDRYQSAADAADAMLALEKAKFLGP